MHQDRGHPDHSVLLSRSMSRSSVRLSHTQMCMQQSSLHNQCPQGTRPRQERMAVQLGREHLDHSVLLSRSMSSDPIFRMRMCMQQSSLHNQCPQGTPPRQVNMAVHLDRRRLDCSVQLSRSMSSVRLSHTQMCMQQSSHHNQCPQGTRPRPPDRLVLLDRRRLDRSVQLSESMSCVRQSHRQMCMQKSSRHTQRPQGTRLRPVGTPVPQGRQSPLQFGALFAARLGLWPFRMRMCTERTIRRSWSQTLPGAYLARARYTRCLIAPTGWALPRDTACSSCSRHDLRRRQMVSSPRTGRRSRSDLDTHRPDRRPRSQ